MSEPLPETPPPVVYAQPWAVRFGFAIIVAFTLIVGLAFMDKAKRTELETVSETTAVGDTAFVKVPDPARAPETVAVLEGKSLAAIDGKVLDLRDTHMRRVGRDAERGLSVYQLIESALPDEKKRANGGSALLLKVAVNQYVIVHPAGQ